MGAESRRQPRRTVPGMVEVTDTMTEDVVGYVGNVSVGGMLLIANRALPTTRCSSSASTCRIAPGRR